MIIETVNQYSEDISILALGPLTNIALALIKDPSLPKKVTRVISIAGTYGFNSSGIIRATGDNPASEWNVYVDPEAAKLVFEANFNLCTLGLDITTQPDIKLLPHHLSDLEASENIEAKIVLYLAQFAQRQGFESYCVLIDSLAVAVLLDPLIIDTAKIRVGVETSSALSRGQTVVDRREHTDGRVWNHLPIIETASAVNAQKYLTLLITTLCT